MRSKRSRKHKHYGPFPMNEYGISAAELTPETAAEPLDDTDDTPTTDSADTMTEQQLLHRQAGGRRLRGWTRFRPLGGRRGAAPLREDEFTDERRS